METWVLGVLAAVAAGGIGGLMTLLLSHERRLSTLEAIIPRIEAHMLQDEAAHMKLEERIDELTVSIQRLSTMLSERTNKGDYL